MTANTTPVFRPPAVPLVAVDPYFSVWSMADRLYDDDSRHWTGERHGMFGLAIIDGQAYRFMGAGEQQPMEQRHVQVDALRTVYTFAVSGVELTVTFTTPLLPDRLELLSRPASYIAFGVKATDGEQHRVQLYVDVTGEWCVNSNDQHIVWERVAAGAHEVMRIGSAEQPVLARDGDNVRIDWGYLYLAVPGGQATRQETALMPQRERERISLSAQLPGDDDLRMPRAVVEDTVVMAALFDWEEVGAQAVEAIVVVAYDDIASIEYFHEPLLAFWRKDGATVTDMLQQAIGEYGELAAQCEAFDAKLREDAEQAGGVMYADMLSLAYRQSFAAHKLVSGPDGKALYFSKECFSNGCIATVDVSYPSTPLFLKYCPELVKGMMRPIFRFAVLPEWPHVFAPHDVGRYPKANGQVYRMNKVEEQMPVEECGNMLIMAATVCRMEGSADFAAEHWDLLRQWANYLEAHGLDPENQNCTDDFTEHLAHNANLSVKAIVAIGCYGMLCKMRGLAEEAARFSEAARSMAAAWEKLALDERGDHYKLTFDREGTWGMKYNLIWDRLLGMELFAPHVWEKELAHYLRMQNKYGTPLDCRNGFTKADWLVWVAAFAADQERFMQMIEPLWHFMHDTADRAPFGDWLETKEARAIKFRHRSVTGGLFIRLLQFPK